MPMTGRLPHSLNSGNTLLRGGLSVTLALWLGISPAMAFPFFHRRPKQESIPPSAQIRPTMIQQATPPAAVEKPPAPLAPIQILVNDGIFPPDAMNRAQPITRAEWAAILVKAIGHNTSLVSEFPFYRDVPLNHPGYAAIEVARDKELLVYQKDHGFYYPENALTYAEAYKSIAQAITGPPPPVELYSYLLKGFSDRDQLDAEELPAVAKMARVHFFRDTKPQTSLQPDAPVTFEGATPLVTYLVHLIQRRAPLQSEMEGAAPVVPAGLNLVLSPTTALLELDMTVGESVRFNLVKAVGPLPKESRFEGVVSESKPSTRSYTVQLSTVKTPEGTVYQTHATFTLGFNPRSRITFFVPGELFYAVSEMPPSSEASIGEPSASPANPTGVPGTVVPPFSPPGSPSAIPAEKAPAEKLPATPTIKQTGMPATTSGFQHAPTNERTRGRR